MNTLLHSIMHLYLQSTHSLIDTLCLVVALQDNSNLLVPVATRCHVVAATHISDQFLPLPLPLFHPPSVHHKVGLKHFVLLQKTLP